LAKIQRGTYGVLLCLITSACAPAPTKETSVVHLPKTITFPYILLDFGSADLYLVELDGNKKYEIGFVEIPSGKHSIIVDAARGPNGFLGVAPFLGHCQGKFYVDLIAGKTYAFKFQRTEISEVIQWIDIDSGKILLDEPCVNTK
jgi:hypothetical protein